MRTLTSLIIAIVLTLLLIRCVEAQVITVGPVTTAHKIVWDAFPNTLAAEAQAFIYRLVDTRDGTASAPLTLGPVTCTGTPYVCTSNLTQAIVDSINRLGAHSLTLTAAHPTGGESMPSVPFSLRVPPAAPTGLRLTQ